MQKKPIGSGWIIFDTETNNPYIHVFWPSEEVADFELKDLLKPYSENDIWRTRLKVIFYNYGPRTI